ncbi:unnamed protein product [Adineta steineri]|uniref:Uncharacterized protein n=1 Tax=Adineta steineri TaxID=433720 RepID=A0A815CI41_9BILA|nr:unnamed protein product [Adineta steineri]CAF3712160.1 unnamed protein product [Adineta steineri]
MHINLLFLFAVFIVVVNSAAIQTSKAKSAYAYLRSVRGNKSCASGTCPFWEKHGRSFAALRCYQQQYQECTCLHRMCFSSCMFTREVCNKEMVQCLQQICPRCMPANSMSMCKVYDSMAVRVADALSVFSCYACCPNINKPNSNNTMMQNGQTIKPPSANGGNSMSQTNSAGAAASATTRAPQNGAGNINNGNKPVNAVNQNKPTNAGIQTKPANTGNQNKPTNAGNQNKPTNAGNQNKPNNGNNLGGVVPGNGNIAVNNANKKPNQNQPLLRKVSTTARTPVQAQKKP